MQLSNSKSPLYFYCFVRTDISLANQMCQIAHSCIEAGKKFGHPEVANLVLLAVPNKAALLNVAVKCDRNRVDYFMNIEPDDDMGETAIATTVISGSTRRIFSGFGLWKPPAIAA